MITQTEKNLVIIDFLFVELFNQLREHQEEKEEKFPPENRKKPYYLHVSLRQGLMTVIFRRIHFEWFVGISHNCILTSNIASPTSCEKNARKYFHTVSLDTCYNERRIFFMCID